MIRLYISGCVCKERGIICHPSNTTKALQMLDGQRRLISDTPWVNVERPYNSVVWVAELMKLIMIEYARAFKVSTCPVLDTKILHTLSPIEGKLHMEHENVFIP